MGSFLGPKLRHRSKFLGETKNNFSWNCLKNYFSQVYEHNFGKRKWGQFGQNRSFFVKMVTIGALGGQNDAIG